MIRTIGDLKQLINVLSDDIPLRVIARQGTMSGIDRHLWVENRLCLVLNDMKRTPVRKRNPK